MREASRLALKLMACNDMTPNPVQPEDSFDRPRYGDASGYLKRIEVRLIYKDITVEMLRDEYFAKAAAKAELYLDEMDEEYQAARTRE